MHVRATRSNAAQMLLGVAAGTIALAAVGLMLDPRRRRAVGARVNEGLEEAARLVVKGRRVVDEGRALLAESRVVLNEGRQVLAQAVADGRTVYRQVKSAG